MLFGEIVTNLDCGNAYRILIKNRRIAAGEMIGVKDAAVMGTQGIVIIRFRANGVFGCGKMVTGEGDADDQSAQAFIQQKAALKVADGMGKTVARDAADIECQGAFSR